MAHDGTISDSARRLGPGVIAIGLASLLSDLGHETATAVLPLFLMAIGGSPLTLGLVEGVADFASSAAKLWAGHLGGRLARRKVPAAGAYFLTAVATASIGLAAHWLHVLLGRTAAWLGRGFRGPLRDTLLAEQTHPSGYGRAFGFERAMDTVGAILGPLFALALLSVAAPLRTILLVTLVPGALAAVLFLTVRERGGVRPGRSFRSMAASLPPNFRRFLLAVGVFGAGDFSRTLLILWALGVGVHIEGGGELTVPVLLYAGYNAVSAASSYVSGDWSDRLGRRPLLLFGYAVAAAVGLLMAFDVRSLPILVAVFVGSGIYVGIEEALERSTAADLLPDSHRAFGFGALAAVNGLGDLVSSVLIGLLWQTAGASVAFGAAAALCLLGVLLLTRVEFVGRR
ncbi:MAG: MFS transporter [Armatimonadota bacterium]|nr:MFS transporter [Armatimonadota bacterium]MDR5697060.1 MFS transporter [Armatimonadota bacterium]